MDPVRTLLLNPDYQEVLAIAKGFRNGLVYGAKIRAPHAFVMVFLFKGGTIKQKLFAVFQATRQHAQNLAKYVTIYKTMMLLLRKNNGGKMRSIDPLISGFVGGYTVFGENNNINQQIVLYVFSRIVLGSVNALAKANADQIRSFSNLNAPRIYAGAWPLFASMCWAVVMYLHEWYPQELQPSLANSMHYLYKQSEKWDGFRNYLYHNV